MKKTTSQKLSKRLAQYSALTAAITSISGISAQEQIVYTDIPDYSGQNAKLLLFLAVVVQMSDVLQYVFGKTLGKHKVVPDVSPNKTWEGLIGGVVSASLIGMGLWWSTPFSPWAALVISLVITIMGFAGGLVMSAIKRDRGIKDFGNMIQGHGGIMDRIDSLCFSAPVFFHIIRYSFKYSLRFNWFRIYPFFCIYFTIFFMLFSQPIQIFLS